MIKTIKIHRIAICEKAGIQIEYVRCEVLFPSSNLKHLQFS